MTGFKSKKTAALDEDGMYLVHQTEQKPVQKIWDTPSEKFIEWWNSDYDDSTNPFTKDTFAYWAWAGWQAELAQPAQEPPPWWPAVENILTEYGLQAIDFVADFNAAMKDAAQPPQRPWVDLTDEEIQSVAKQARSKDHAVTLANKLLKEKNT